MLGSEFCGFLIHLKWFSWLFRTSLLNFSISCLLRILLSFSLSLQFKVIELHNTFSETLHYCTKNIAQNEYCTLCMSNEIKKKVYWAFLYCTIDFSLSLCTFIIHHESEVFIRAFFYCWSEKKSFWIEFQWDINEANSKY